jgi:threonine/homoserine/homoserine lactone efflux protein
VPQFVDRSHPILPQVLLLGGIHLAVTLVWLTAYAQLVSRARRVFAGAWLQRTTGAVLVALGVRVALER